MNKILKAATFFILILSSFAVTSCLHKNNDERTAQVETSEITKYILLLKQTGNTVDTTASGLYYVIYTKGSGATPQPGDTCEIEYVGYFMNGVIFDASAEHYTKGIREIIYKSTDLIPGFDEAIGLLNKGSESTFVIPSKLAYGDVWYDFIPPYTPLIFDINLHDIKPKAE